jgi:hypothetical protein
MIPAPKKGNLMNDYKRKTEDELRFIMKDAAEAAECMKGMDPKAEAKYLDQVNDAATELYRRRKPSRRPRPYVNAYKVAAAMAQQQKEQVNG